ncbi:hypothetical protein IFM89_035445 [Coptis chinensis]|uniref:Pentatricopeptide repeat-containing protein n=1 Tax=Coptis chinensis TaxID=261450 RepID=A0A835HHJ9_9MAGN|nr:hypothetical protein IFM89_035445 [Coptis chinensis]
MYARCGELDEAVKVFDEVSQRGISDVVLWNSIMSAFVRSGEVGKALNMFGGMNSRVVGLRADVASLVNILLACASVGALMQGKQVHGYAVRSCLFKDVFVCNALVAMYARCGELDEAVKVFDEVSQRGVSDVVSWNSIVGAFVRRNLRIMDRQGHNSSKGKHVVTECEVTKPPVTRQKQVRWYPSMDEILIEVLLEKTLNGLGKKSDNGWKPETLKEVAEAVNQRLNMSIGSENEGGNARHDNEEVVILDEEVGDEGADNIEEESSQPPSPHPNANDVDSSQVKRKRYRLGLEAMPPPPNFKELIEAVRQLTSAFNPVEPTTLLVDALEALPNMEPDIMLRAFDLLGENEQLLKVFLGINNPQFQYVWLMRKLQQ